ncbi:MAG: hypothetical protein WB563_21940, partial [Pseudolabrys sp.]
SVDRAQQVPRHTGFMPGIHVFRHSQGKDVDGRDKPGHDKKSIKAAIRLTQPQQENLSGLRSD